MTLQSYDPEKLDQFALQLLDLAAIVRKMANRSRENDIADMGLHDKKAWQWCANLRQWAEKAQAELEVKILQSRAEQRGRAARIP